MFVIILDGCIVDTRSTCESTRCIKQILFCCFSTIFKLKENIPDVTGKSTEIFLILNFVTVQLLAYETLLSPIPKCNFFFLAPMFLTGEVRRNSKPHSAVIILSCLHTFCNGSNVKKVSFIPGDHDLNSHDHKIPYSQK